MQDFIEKFIHGYKALNSKSRDESRQYNWCIRDNKYVMIHPMIFDEDTVELLITFSDNNQCIWPIGEDLQREVFEYVEKTNRKYFTFLACTNPDDINEINETIYIETSRFSEISLETGSWEQLLNSPKIEEGEFSLLNEPFSTFFNLDEYYDNDFDVWGFFQESNKPSDVELRVVWKDVDSGNKYGNINTLIFWQGEFIGWVSSGSKWLSTHVYNTVNVERWAAFMQYLYQCSGQKRKNTLRGIEVIDMNSVTDVESVISIPGLTEPNYGE